MQADWIEILGQAYIALCLLCAVVVLLDIARGKRHKMAIMNVVWPMTALYMGPVAVWGHRQSLNPEEKPFWWTVFVGATHCGAGCAIGDFIGEWIRSHSLWTRFGIDFALAYLFGVVFQYYSIAPMRNISGWPGIVAAIKADTVSLISFEVGMFGWMALSHEVLAPGAQPDSFLFWFLMQMAMIVGFATCYPANWWLIRRGIKEAMA